MTIEEKLIAAGFEVVPTAEELIAAGYVSVSNKYRRLTRIPPGKTAIQALEEVSPYEARLLRERLEEWAASRYLRCFAPEHIELTQEEFAAFKAAGGQSAR